MTASFWRRSPALLAMCGLLGALSACKGTDASGESGAPAGAAAKASGEDALSTQITQMAQDLAGRVGGRTVAVLDFPDLNGRVTELGSLVSEQLTTDLVRAMNGNSAGGGKVLERKQVIRVLEELNLRKADLTSSEVQLAAQQLGADVVVVGSASVVGKKIEVNSRAVDVSGGSVLTAGRFSQRADDDLLQLADRQASAGASATAGGGASASAQPGAPVLQTTLGPVEAKLTECRATGSEVACSFVFTSATVDAKLAVDWSTEARDEGGNAYRVTDFTFGSENGSEWNTLLVAKEATPGRLILTGVPINIGRLTRIALNVQLAIGERTIDGQQFVFRNVAIARDPG